MRAVRLADSALDDIERQRSPELAVQFKSVDLRPVLEALVEPEAWNEDSVPFGPGRRITIDGARTVAGFHLFVTEDLVDPREGAIVVCRIDIWLDEFPDRVRRLVSPEESRRDGVVLPLTHTASTLQPFRLGRSGLQQRWS